MIAISGGMFSSINLFMFKVCGELVTYGKSSDYNAKSHISVYLLCIGGALGGFF